MGDERYDYAKCETCDERSKMGGGISGIREGRPKRRDERWETGANGARDR